MSSVEFIGPLKGSALDFESFIALPEQVPNIVAVGRLDEMQQAIEKLFEFPPRSTFACFKEPEMFSLKRLFRQKIHDRLNINEAISRIDEHGKGEKKLFDLLYKLIDLDNILQDIRCRMSSLLKS